jgi:hypothetical protein
VKTSPIIKQRRRPSVALRISEFMQKHYLLLALSIGFLLPNRALGSSPVFTPNIFTDPAIANETDVNWTTGALSVGPNAGDVSLRSAVIAANHNPGSGVQLSGGTYHLTIPGGITTAGTGEAYTGNPLIGDLDIKANDVTIFGAGMDQTTIVQEAPSGGSNDRVIEVNPDLIANFNFTITDLTITGGQTPDGGGGLLAGSQNNALTIARVNFNHNSATGDGSAGGAIWFLGGGTLNITESVFSNNSTTTSSGGAIDFFANPNPGSLTLTKSRFSSNTSSGGGDGGALRVAGDLSSDSLIGVCAFTQNSVGGASAQGGAISVQSSTHNLNIAFNRFYQNSAATAANGKTLASSGSTAVTANQNWWGLNTGPDANDVLGLTPANWLQLRAAPADTTVPTGGSTTINADVFGLNSGGSVPSASLSGLPAFALSGTTTLGSLSTAGTQFVNADATTTFTAGSTAGFAAIQVTADGETATVNISVPTTVTSIARATASPSNLSTVEWDVTLADPVDLLVAGNFSLVPGTGLGTASINGITPVGATPTAIWRVSANVAPGDGTLGLDMVNDTGASADVTNLPFTGEVYLIDRIPPSTQIGPPSVGITGGGPVSYNMVYVDDNFGSSSIGVGDIALNKTGTANGLVGVSVVGNQVQITISSITGDGTLGISIAGGTAVDTAGNLADAGGPSATFMVDNTNDDPTISGAVAGQGVNDNSTISPFSGVIIGDPDLPAQTLHVVVTLDNPNKGAFTTLKGFSPVLGGYEFTGTAADATTAIQGLVFDPADNRVPPTLTETTGFTINVKDTAGGVANNTTTTVISTSINDPPVAGNFTITRQPGQETKISIEEILSHASDPDVGNLSLNLPSGTTANGATISNEGRWVLYLAPTSDTTDTFSYTVTDSQAATASGVITVIVQPDDTQSKNILSITQDGTDYVIKFFGIPTQSYTIQATEDLGNPQWQDRGTITAGPSGLTEFRDVNPPATSKFYRTHTP